MPLTEVKIKSAKSKDKSYRLYDEKGLYLEVFPNGSKLWRWKYRFDGKEKRAALGPYPEVSLKQARDLVLEKRAILRGGDDPQSRNREQANFNSLADEWIKIKGAGWTDGHRRTVELRVEKYLRPALGGRDATLITAQDILKILRAIEDNGAVETAHRVLSYCSMIYRYGVATQRVASDPCRDLQGALTPYKSVPFPAITTPREAGALLRAIDDFGGTIIVKCALLFSALTFCRPIEIRQAEWIEIDFDGKVWVIPAEKTKMRKIHHVPLAVQALAVLEKIKLFTGHGKYVFPSARTLGRCMSEAAVLAALRRMGYAKEEMTAHGFRAMASTLLNELGYNFDVIEAQLAHEGYDKIRAIYNRAQYMDERRKLMQDWADYLDKLRAGPRHPE